MAQFAPGSQDNKRVAAHWSQMGGCRIGDENARMWLQLPQVQARINAMVSGAPDLDWVDWAFSTAFGIRLPVDRAIALAVGTGTRIGQMVEAGRVKQVDAYDIAPGVIERARAIATANGYHDVNFQVADANTLRSEPGIYDCAFIETGLHHFKDLETVYSNLQRALKPDGLLIFNDYVGAPYFQFSRRQVRQMNAVLQTIPLPLRNLHSPVPVVPITSNDVSGQPSTSPGRSTPESASSIVRKLRERVADGSLLGSLRRIVRTRLFGPYQWEIVRPSRAGIIAVDPSEAVRSNEVISAMAPYFEIVEQRGYGGGILHWLLNGIAHNFIGARGACELERLFSIEDGLIARGEINHDFVVVIARPRPLP